MATPLEDKKIKLEILEKALIAITLVIAIITSTYKGYEFFSAKSQEVKKRTESIEALTIAYTDSLKNIDAEIKELDDKLSNTSYKGSFNWDKFIVIRDEKSKDRAVLLEKLGSQIVELKRAEK